VSARAGILALLVAATTVAGPSRGVADSSGPDSPRRWLSIGLLGGSTQWNPKLADYQWSVTPHAGFGAEAVAGFGRWEAGARVIRTGTSQTIGVPGAIDEAAVHATSFEAVARRSITSWRSIRASMIASTGLLHLGYDPDRVSIPSSGSGSTEVTLAPLNAWIGGAGLTLRRPLGGVWSLGLEVEQEIFALDTAHRNGSAIEQGSTSFGDWSARFELARIFASR
jgi:hypothetical protein